MNGVCAHGIVHAGLDSHAVRGIAKDIVAVAGSAADDAVGRRYHDAAAAKVGYGHSRDRASVGSQSKAVHNAQAAAVYYHERGARVARLRSAVHPHGIAQVRQRRAQ